MINKFIPKLRENVVLLEQDDEVFKLKSCQLEDNFILVNRNSSIIINSINGRDNVDTIINSIFSNSNARSSQQIEDQFDQFMFKLLRLREYIEPDYTGYYIKKYLMKNRTIVDPFGDYTKKIFDSYEVNEIFRNFYFSENFYLLEGFFDSLQENFIIATISLDEKDNISLITLIQLDDTFKYFEILGIFSLDTKLKLENVIEELNIRASLNLFAHVFYMKSINKNTPLLFKYDKSKYKEYSSIFELQGELKKEYGDFNCTIATKKLT